MQRWRSRGWLRAGWNRSWGLCKKRQEVLIYSLLLLVVVLLLLLRHQ